MLFISQKVCSNIMWTYFKITKNLLDKSYYNNSKKLLSTFKVFFKTEIVFTIVSDFIRFYTCLSTFNSHFSNARAKEISYKNFKDLREDSFN